MEPLSVDPRKLPRVMPSDRAQILKRQQLKTEIEAADRRKEPDDSGVRLMRFSQ
jgi:hypothetical protein